MITAANRYNRIKIKRNVKKKHMSYDWYDVAHDMAMEEIHNESVMARATREQCIFLFVEGESEETAIPILLTDVVDLDALGVIIANYNGHGNLSAALRLLKFTLSHDRPIILTYDNDPASVSSLHKCEQQGLIITNLVYQFPIPIHPIVTYPSGYCGGTFEESFPVEIFLKAAFNSDILPEIVVSKRGHFDTIFDIGKPWFLQLKKFNASLGFTDWETKKTSLAGAMARECAELPSTYQALAHLIKEVRKKHPVIHPGDVELPKVQGLTYFPDKESLNKLNESSSE
ncbi:MAG: hypothetical protein L6290_06605 [Thermodesulfovibrionales bacterium]|nr:hypothetical protein [Thermodesulfovibrionales bacterium]